MSVTKIFQPGPVARPSASVRIYKIYVCNLQCIPWPLALYLFNICRRGCACNQGNDATLRRKATVRCHYKTFKRLVHVYLSDTRIYYTFDFDTYLDTTYNRGGKPTFHRKNYPRVIKHFVASNVAGGGLLITATHACSINARRLDFLVS